MERSDFLLPHTSQTLPVYSWKGCSIIRRVVVVVHGMKRRIDDTLQLVADWANDSLVLAPLFATAKLGGSNLSVSNILFAKGGDYCEGKTPIIAPSSTNDPALSPPQLTSFAMADILLAHAVNIHSPTHLVLLGFSAGAQFWNRFAAVSTILQQIRDTTNVSLVLGTSSSWLYLHPLRIDPMLTNITLESQVSEKDFILPIESDALNGYNDWKYGLNNIPSSLLSESADTLEVIRKRALAIPITFILVSDDTKGGDSLDSSPQALVQCKSHRFERACVYVHYLRNCCREIFEQNGMDVAVAVKTIVVHECGHDARKVFAQQAVKEAVFL
ncbi:hypothetical protein BDR26DRAFT_859845 [Obelidium mucronatum]|nr:hypothetical protein BDR26DRAFT_859845 [Obelidium mucronatum]